MTYRKANRHLTEEQFSEGTTIDGSRIDKAIDDIMDNHNNVRTGDMEARWMPNTINCNWQPSRTLRRFILGNAINGGQRYAWCQRDYLNQAWFPFLISHNAANEVFPSNEQPDSFQNEFRTKGYYYVPDRDVVEEELERVATGVGTIDTGADVNDLNSWAPVNSLVSPRWVDAPIPGPGVPHHLLGNGTANMHHKYFTLTIPLYFKKPIIITNISVFAASEHPLGAYNSFIDTAVAPIADEMDIGTDGYKAQTAANQAGYDCYMPNNNLGDAFERQDEQLFSSIHPQANSLVPTCGFEMPGDLYTSTQRNIGDGTIQIIQDNEFLKEKRQLNNIIFNKTGFSDSVYRFNRFHTTTNRNNTGVGPIVLGSTNGLEYQDMQPQFSGGSTWGVWIKEDGLNIPVSRDSRLRFCVTAKGYRSTLLFDWHIALTFLEQVED